MVAESVLPFRTWTIEDLFDMPDDDCRYEIVDGQLVMVPPPQPSHQYVAGRLRTILEAQLGANVVVLEAVGVGVGHNYRIPDVGVFDPAVLKSSDLSAKPGQVFLAVEIVSPSSVTTDTITKPVEYARAGIPTFWRIESPLNLVAYRLVGSAYEEVGMWGPGDVAHLEVPDPVRIAIDDLSFD